jgi:anti-sigma B factor antagonist
MKTVIFRWRTTPKTVPFDGDITAQCEQRGAECRVSLSGRITIDSSPDVSALLLERLQAPGCETVVLDLSDVGYVDTSGVATLVEVLKAARKQGKNILLSGLQERPRFLLESTRLLRLFQEVDR